MIRRGKAALVSQISGSHGGVDEDWPSSGI
jgi:hypothetical protein